MYINVPAWNYLNWTFIWEAITDTEAPTELYTILKVNNIIFKFSMIISIIMNLMYYFRHLLSDQTDPFNRSPLSMDQVKSNTELKERIEAWIAEQKQKIAQPQTSDS